MAMNNFGCTMKSTDDYYVNRWKRKKTMELQYRILQKKRPDADCQNLRKPSMVSNLEVIKKGF